MESTANSVSFGREFGDRNRDATRTVEAALAAAITKFRFDCRYSVKPTRLLINIVSADGAVTLNAETLINPDTPVDVSEIIEDVRAYLLKKLVLSSPEDAAGAGGDA